jgi:hypothetical protein
MRIEVGPGAQSDSTFRIYVSADYLDKLDHTELQPAPVTSGYSGDFAFFDFVRLDPGQPAAVIIYAEPKGYGRISARVATVGGAPLGISQLILP